MNKELYIIDSHALVYRAYYAFQRLNLKTPAGFPTGACYGFAQYLMGILNQYKPSHIVAVMDSGKPNWRHSRFPGYKNKRQKMPEDLIKQLPKIKEIIDAFGIPLEMFEGVEADDIIYSLTVNAVREDFKVSIISKDKDLMACIKKDKVRMLSPNGSGVFDVIDTDYVIKKFGVPPHCLFRYLALVGDSSDNIPGVKGIGPKKAVTLINSGEDSPIYNSPQYRLSLELVTLKLYDCLEQIDLYKHTCCDIERICKIFDELNIVSLKNRLLKGLQ